MNFEKGQIVEHILDKEWVLVLEVNVNSITCRTKDFQVIEFRDFELRKRYNGSNKG